ncbi:MAG: hypothetical protein KIT73_04525 [Burkholderiales bacterium]|nr:hypothetical protein [Burkholderiales bacterium]
MTALRVLIVADDLTGAMDAAGPFAARGVPTVVAALPERCNADAFDAAQVVAINTESRHLSSADAVARVTTCLGGVGAQRFGLVVKKVDSTLRGNVVAETAAVLAALGKQEALVATAFPAQGRTVQGGQVFVRGVPLAQTPFAQDALSPALTVPLSEAYGAARIRARVIDADVDADLDKVAATALSGAIAPLLVGSAGLTAALARATAPQTVGIAPAVTGPILYLVGSRAQASRTQVARLGEEGVTIVRAPNGEIAPEGLPLDGDVALQAVAGGDGREGDANVVAERLAQWAVKRAAAGPLGAIVATGGDTAVALLRVSGNVHVSVGGELMPGIAFARLRLPGCTPWLVTKAGGFGDAEALAEIGRRLRITGPACAA